MIFNVPLNLIRKILFHFLTIIFNLLCIFTKFTLRHSDKQDLDNLNKINNLMEIFKINKTTIEIFKILRIIINNCY